MKKIKIFDTTLRDGEQAPGFSMSKEDKVMVAKKLNDMKVDVIEAGFAASNDSDFEAIQNMANCVDYSTLCSLARCNENDIDIAYEAIKDAKKKGIHIFIGTSPIHMKHKLKKTPEEVLVIIDKMVRYAKSKVDMVEFSLEDATRTDKDFACLVINTAIKAGATTINIPDTVGYTTPWEFYEFITYLRKHSLIDNVDISVHCHNDLGLATANSMSAIRAGVNQIECTINGIGERAGNTALEEVVANIDTRSLYYNAYTDVDLSMIADASKTIEDATGEKVQKNKAIVGKNAFRHEAGIHQQGMINDRRTYEIMNPKRYGISVDGIVLGIHSGKNAVILKMKEMNYNIDSYDIDGIMSDLKLFFASKISVGDRGLITEDEFNCIVKSHKFQQKKFSSIGEQKNKIN